MSGSPFTVLAAAALDKAVEKLLAALEQESGALGNGDERKAFRDHWLARKDGILTQINKLWLKAAPKEAKREVGQRVNKLKTEVEAKVEAALKRTPAAGTESAIDISFPGIRRAIGAEHPIIRTQNEIVSVFKNLGYSVAEGPVIETDYYNFEALNFPPNHPARDTQDTLFLANQQSKARREQLLLRTHTSPVQIRTMEKMKPPLRIVIPGKVHRNDPPDASHSPMFHQVEGLAVDTNITFGDEIVVWVGREDQLPAVVLPIHRAERGDVRFMFHLRRQRQARFGQRAVPSVQTNGMDRNSRVRYGRSECVRVREA